MKVRVEVRPRDGIADPEGATIARALQELGYAAVGGVQAGRALWLELEEEDPARAEALVEEMCERLLANPVTEDYEVRVVT